MCLLLTFSNFNKRIRVDSSILAFFPHISIQRDNVLFCVFHPICACAILTLLGQRGPNALAEIVIKICNQINQNIGLIHVSVSILTVLVVIVHSYT